MNRKQQQRDKIKKLMCSTENNNKAKKIFHELTTKKIYIYGAGNAGERIFKFLKDSNLEVRGFFDRRGENGKFYCNRPVYKIGKEITQKKITMNSIIIIAYICKHAELIKLKQRLLANGWKSIYYFYDIYNSLICNKIGCQYSSLSLNNYKDSEMEKILNVASFMEDDNSYEIYEKIFKAITNSNSELFPLPSKMPQYFVNDISFSKGYSRFVDCGAFDGDTAFALKRYKGEVEGIVLFEPDSNNFRKLYDNLNKNKVAKKQIFFPYGVWKNREIRKFKISTESSSGISENGDRSIECVSIDEVIGDFAPTFIKMDVEGAELEALEGCEQTIKKYEPDLAISVYHDIEHIWQIPLLIKNIQPKYKLYLRCHGVYGLETVLYATMAK